MLIPKTMSTQHPDNVHAPFFAENSVLEGDDEIKEAFYAYSHLKCQQQLWDCEGKEVDTHVVKKLISRYDPFFTNHRLGKDFFLTLRVPNPIFRKFNQRIFKLHFCREIQLFILATIITYMKIFFSHKCLEYRQEGHPESPARVKSIYKHIKDKFDFSEAKPCTDKDLMLCHEKDLINRIRHRKFSDADTPNLPGIFDFAKLAAGTAIQAAKHAVETSENSFSLMRPPGHHAGKNFLGGFCYFNNIAIGVKKMLEKVDKVAIIDIDGHHGNGTQDIFTGNKSVLFISLHQKNAFPVSGFVSDRNCYNYPLLPGTSGKDYLKIFNAALEDAENFGPDIIAVSAGFDAYKKDPLLELGLDIETYFEIGDMISQLGVPVFSVLEGGYSQDIDKCVYQFLKGLG